MVARRKMTIKAATRSRGQRPFKGSEREKRRKKEHWRDRRRNRRIEREHVPFRGQEGGRRWGKIEEKKKRRAHTPVRTIMLPTKDDKRGDRGRKRPPSSQ